MKRIFTGLFIPALLVMGSLSCTNIQAEVPTNAIAQSNGIAPMLKQAMPAVVNIVVQGQVPQITDPFLKRQLEQHYKGIQTNGNKFVAIGSGVIIDAKKGYIITNAHVVDQAKTVIVTLSDGRKFIARPVGADDAYDIAVLQITATHLTALPYAEPNSLTVGDFVATIGSPFGLNQTVTSGIVSALNRSGLGIEGFENFIQTDAPINVGNSGGALVNMQGQLVGINTAIVGPAGGNVGIGFAIPADIVKNIVDQLIAYGKVARGLLGVQVQTLTPDLADAFQLNNQEGAVVTLVSPYSPAAKSGLQVGDVIVQANGQTITNNAQIRNMVGLMRTGSELNLSVIRGGKTMTLTAKIENATKSDTQLRMANPYLFGVTTRDLVGENPTYGFIHGTEVTNVAYDTPAWISGLQAGDIIISANHQPVQNVQDLQKIAEQSPDGLLLNVLRVSGSFFIVIK